MRKNHFLRIVSIVIMLVAMAAPEIAAQNVFVSPTTGKLIASLTSGTEVGFENGGSAVWKHEQLPLTISVADHGDFTSAGELSNPAGNLIEYNGYLCLEGGSSYDSYMMVSLPKGFRFTGYSITLVNNLNNTDILGGNGACTKWFYETSSSWDYTQPLQTAKDNRGNSTMSSTNSETEYTISRNATDMSNRLYFMIRRGSNEFFGLTIKSFEIFFTAESEFTETLIPSTSGTTSYAESPFEINKLELGEIKQRTKNNKTYYAFTYVNVQDLMANIIVYQSDAVRNGKAADVASVKTISSNNYNGSSYFGLGNNTYFVEPPTTVTGKSGAEMPVGYRVTGAKLTCAYNAGGMALGRTIRNTTYYLGTDLMPTTTPVYWTWDGSKLRSGKTYLMTIQQGDWWNVSYTLTTTTNSDNASNYSIDSRGLYTTISSIFRYYITLSTSGQASLSTRSTYAVSSINIPAGSDYTVKLFGKDKTTPVATKTISASSPTQTLEVSGLNNDAVMFTVEGLSSTISPALVSIDLSMQALNPYIHSLDIVSHDDHGNTLTKAFTADNFAVRGGHFVFNVPESQTGSWWFSFENLKSNYADETYPDGSSKGKVRHSFVESEYYKATPSLYAETYDPNADYTKKVYVDVAGTEPFYFNNLDVLGNTSGATDSKYFIEYPFSVEKYKNPDHGVAGAFEKFTLKEKEKKNAFLFVSDETRYNIAPTTATDHRYYAYYLMDIELLKKTYQPAVTFTKVYDKTFIEGSKEGNLPSFWGAKVTTTDKNESGAYGYLSIEDIDTAIKEEIEKGGENMPADSDKLLYVDLSDLEDVIYPTNTGLETAFDVFRASYSPNTLVFLPKGLTTPTDNCAARTGQGNAFYASRNIILRDKYPFFSPYDINILETNYAKYTREIISHQGKTVNSTLILPFKLSIDKSGIHTNSGTAGDGVQFQLHKLQPSDCISTAGDNATGEILSHEGNYVHFLPYTSSTLSTEANVPYMVKTVTPSEDDEIVFTALQYGAKVEATGNYNSTDYYFSADASTGRFDNTELSLTPRGTFSGRCIPKTESLFYFAADRFRSSWSLKGYNNVYLYPFRAYFALTSGTPSRDISFGLAFSENEGSLNAIEHVNAYKGSGIIAKAGIGTLTLTGSTETNVKIFNASGEQAATLQLSAGEEKTVNVPAGVYIVDGKKYIVK